MRIARRWIVLILCCTGTAHLSAQEGRVFNLTDETVGIWEFNDLEATPGEALPEGSIIPDQSGNGRNATVEGSGAGDLVVVEGDPGFGEENTLVDRFGATPRASVLVNGDDGAFEMAENQDFTVELYVRRGEFLGGAQWGILAGNWHSRNVVDDDSDVNQGAWYGYGLLRNAATDGWMWVLSPINSDGTYSSGSNEIKATFDDVTPGYHYIVLSVDRELDTARAYIDGRLGEEEFLPPDSAFISPNEFDTADFRFFTGEDDPTRDRYRLAPTGMAIDAARVLKRSLSAEEVLDNWLLIQKGIAVPAAGATPCQAVISATSQDVFVDQCIRFDSAGSRGIDRAEIETYEWKIGDGEFEEEGDILEISFDEPTGEEDTQVTLRVTDVNGESCEKSLSIRVTQPPPRAVIDATSGERVFTGRAVILIGEVLSLSGINTTADVPAGVFSCPLDAGNPLPQPEVLEYRWDLDSDGTVDDTRDEFDMPPAEEIGEFTITLEAVTDAGGIDDATLVVSVIDTESFEPGPPGSVFLQEDATVAIWEFNDLDAGLDEGVPNGSVVTDTSGSGNDAFVEVNDGGEIVVGAGDPDFEENTTAFKFLPSALARVGTDPVGRGADLLEMDENQDFSVELYIHRDEFVGGESWGILAGTWHSRNIGNAGLPALGAWYGYGLIRNNASDDWMWILSPIHSDGTFEPGFNEIKPQPSYTIPVGNHYLVLTVNRKSGEALTYMNGELIGSAALPFGEAFITPTDHDPARFMFLAGENDVVRNSYMPAPTGFGIDATRVTRRAFTPEEIRAWNDLIRVGVAVPPTPAATGTPFHRGDTDGDGAMNLTDGIRILNFLFLGGPESTCSETQDFDNSGAINISDGISVFNFLFLGGVGPAEPGPPPGACALDPDEPGSVGDLGCNEYEGC